MMKKIFEDSRKECGEVAKSVSPTNEKRPYIKPELHLLNLESTEGKTFTRTAEYTSAGRSYGPS